MGERIDDLEKHVADLMTEAGIENTNEELRVKKLHYVLLYSMYFHLVLSYGQHLVWKYCFHIYHFCIYLDFKAYGD